MIRFLSFSLLYYRCEMFYSRYALPRDLDPLLVFLGTAPMCDHGESLTAALNVPKEKLQSAFPLFNPCTTHNQDIIKVSDGSAITMLGEGSKEELKPLCVEPRKLSGVTLSPECWYFYHMTTSAYRRTRSG